MIKSFTTVDFESAFEETKQNVVRASASITLDDDGRASLARRLGYESVAAYWQASVGNRDGERRLHPPKFEKRSELSEELRQQARLLGELAALRKPVEAGYRLGSLYAALLPAKYRSRRGIFYTPPALAARLLSTAEMHGVDWKIARVLDPACGGGAFLAPVAVRMMHALDLQDPEEALRSIESRLFGYDIDEFGAWAAQVFVETALLPLCRRAGRRLRPVITVRDSLLQFASSRKFDLVVANPPYGRIRLRPGLREKYDRSLFGHANLYTLFTDLSLRLAKPSGLISLVTPTSFLAGEYFKSLRRVMLTLAEPVNFDFVSARKGIFDQVLQETMLATYRKGRPSEKTVSVNVIRPDGKELRLDRIGRFRMPANSSEPWSLPRTRSQRPLITSMREHKYRLKDYGYEVATGQLVWNRHKDQLHGEHREGRLPLIWAESIGPDGTFEFRAEKRNHEPYFEPRSGEDWLITRKPCILLQRTTAKEQSRRLIAAILPQDFLDEWGGAVVENHLNIIRPIADSPAVPLEAMVHVLNSDVLDEAFRCINGSVAVSAYELNALPLPEPDAVFGGVYGDDGEMVSNVTSHFNGIYQQNRINATSRPTLRRGDPRTAA